MIAPTNLGRLTNRGRRGL